MCLGKVRIESPGALGLLHRPFPPGGSLLGSGEPQVHLRGRHREPGVGQGVPPVEAQRLLERVDGRPGSALTAEGQRGATAQVALVGRCVLVNP